MNLIEYLEDPDDLDELKELAATGVDPNSLVFDDSSLLFLTCRVGNREVVEYLTSLPSIKQYINIRDPSDKTTPLWHACTHDDIQLIQYLLDAGANPNKSNDKGITPMMHVLESSYNLDIITALLKAGADINKMDSEYRSILFRIDPNDTNGIKYMIDNEIDLDIYCEDNYTYLSEVVRVGNVDGVKLLLDAGANPNPETADDGSLLGIDMDDNSRKIMRLLLAAGTNPNKQDFQGNTPLHLIAERGYYKELKLLLQAGADVNIVNYNNETPLDYYYLAHEDDLEEMSPEIAYLFISNGGTTDKIDILSEIADDYADAYTLTIFTRRCISENNVDISALPDTIKFN